MRATSRRAGTSGGTSRRELPPTDVLVIGGGVHGAAIARDAAARGASVRLVEKHDVAWATSSRSSKLAHGGLRYLEKLQLGLVRESLHERDALLRLAPHLSWPLPFLIPLEGSVPRPAWQVRVGLFTYGLLAGRSKLAGHRTVGRETIEELAPALAASGVSQAALYHDAGMDDARIAVELARDAAELGADVRVRCEALRLRRSRGRVVGALLREETPGGTVRELEARARVTVAAAGPWTNALAGRREDGSRRLVLTKGVHLFTPRRLVTGAALLLAAPQDQRVFFVIPWKAGTLIGTTDTTYRGAPDAVRPTADDARYLSRALAECLPGVQLAPEEIVAAQAGLRPLASKPGAAPGDDSPSALSRDWELDAAAPGLLVVEGGKYTIFRKLAESVVDRIARVLRGGGDGDGDGDGGESVILDPCTTRVRRLPGAPDGDWDDFARSEPRRLQRRGVAGSSARHLVATRGARAMEVAAIAREADDDPGWLLRPACDDHAHVPAEALHALRHEIARGPADVLLRRLGLGWTDCGGVRCRASWERAFRVAGLSKGAISRGLAQHEAELDTDWRLG